jgi:hypothetical protein
LVEASPRGGRRFGGRGLVEPLLKGVEGVDPALELGGGGATLQLQLPGVHHGAQDGEAACSNVLAAVLQPPESDTVKLYCYFLLFFPVLGIRIRIH